MALITRVSRLFRADLHAVLDHIEEPEALLRQAIREMQEVLDNDARQVKRLQLEQGQIVARQTDLEGSLGLLEEELEVCFQSNKDDLARKLIKRKLETQGFSRILARKHQALEETLRALRNRLEENRTRLEGMRQKAELLSEEDSPSQTEACWNIPDFSVREEDVEVAFLREKQQRNRP